MYLPLPRSFATIEFNDTLQPKPVYSNHFFAEKNDKKEPIVRKNR